MKLYLTYAQTPELMSLETDAQRDDVHSRCWRQLRASRPSLWTVSFGLIVALCAIGALVGYALSAFLGIWRPTDIAIVSAAVSSGIGALLHIHMTANQLRPLYASEIARREHTGPE